MKRANSRPTTRPIIRASSEEKSTMSTRRLPSPIRPRPAPSPNRAVTIGSPIASKEPKLSSSTMTAALRPTAVAKPRLGCWACLIASPPSSTCKAGERAAWALSITRSIEALGSSFARWSNSTVAKPIVPSLERAFAPAAYGPTTPATCGSRPIRPSSGAMTARAEASPSLPVRARKTIWSTSPACAGKRLWSRSTARCESVFGSEKLFAFRLPTAWERARTPTARTIQEKTTIRRCVIVQRVSFSIGELQSERERSCLAKLHDVQRLVENCTERKYSLSAGSMRILTADEPATRPTRAQEAADTRDDRPRRARALRPARLPRHDPAGHRGGGRRLDANDLRLLREQGRHPLQRLPGDERGARAGADGTARRRGRARDGAQVHPLVPRDREERARRATQPLRRER